MDSHSIVHLDYTLLSYCERISYISEDIFNWRMTLGTVISIRMILMWILQSKKSGLCTVVLCTEALYATSSSVQCQPTILLLIEETKNHIFNLWIDYLSLSACSIMVSVWRINLDIQYTQLNFAESGVLNHEQICSWQGPCLRYTCSLIFFL